MNRSSNRFLVDVERLLAVGRTMEAVRLAELGLRTTPRDYSLGLLLAEAWLQAGRPQDALGVADRLDRMIPGRVASAWIATRAALALGDRSRARQGLAAVMDRTPVGGAWEQAGDLALELDDWGLAEQAFSNAILQAARPVDFLKRGLARQGAGKLTAALEDYTVSMPGLDDPLRYTALLNKGSCLFQLDRFTASAEAAEAAAALRPGDAVANFNAGSAWLEAGEVTRAIAAYARSSMPRAASAGLYALQFLDPGEPDALFAAHQRWGMGQCADSTPPSFPANRSTSRRLRVGFVSSDFRHHPVAMFCEGWMAALDAARFERFVYLDSSQHDDTTARFADWADRFVTCAGVPDTDLVDRLRADELDVLIEFGSHVGDRAALLARRIAPVQMTYLGYPGTSGLASVDYYLTDELLDPPGAEMAYSEALLRVGPTSITYRPPDLDIPVAPLPALTRGRLTLASFNRPSKLSGPTLRRWARVLAAIPEARLIVVGKGLDDPAGRARIEGVLLAEGVAADRLQFLGSLPFEDYLRWHEQIDLVLDCGPWSGHTVTLHAAWMGVPTLTRVYPSHSGRFSAATMTLLGQADFVTHSDDAFVARAEALATDLPALAALRETLRSRLLASPLTDHVGLAQRIGETLREAYRRARDAP